MEEFFQYVFNEKIYINFLMEFIAALAGSIYLLKVEHPIKDSRLFVYFLWSVYIIDSLGTYTGIAYFSNYEMLSFVKNTPFQYNQWYYNIANIYFFVCYLYFIRNQIQLIRYRTILKWCIVAYLILAVFNLFLSGDFFVKYITANFLGGVFLCFFAVFLYFYDMLMSDYLLYFYRNLFFYVILGIIIQVLVTAPINIYDEFVTWENVLFTDVFRAVLQYANIFMYSMFAFGFLMDYRYRKNVNGNFQKA